MKTSFEKFMASSAVNKVELGAVKIELALIDDIMSDVDANGVGRDKARPLIRDIQKNLGTIIEIYQRIEARNEKLKKSSAQFQAKIKELGIDPNTLDQISKNIYNNLYVRDVTQDLKALKDAGVAIKNTSEAI